MEARSGFYRLVPTRSLLRARRLYPLGTVVGSFPRENCRTVLLLISFSGILGRGVNSVLEVHKVMDFVRLMYVEWLIIYILFKEALNGIVIESFLSI